MNMHKYVYEVLEDQQKKTSTASAMFLKGRPFCSDYTLFDFLVIAFQFSCFFSGISFTGSSRQLSGGLKYSLLRLGI